jgi:hypothetical protein
MAEQPVLGVLLLDTHFPRIPGDVGHPDSYPFPIRRLTVPGATVQRAVYEANPALAELFVEAARQLESEGVCAITSSCGFLAPLQKDVARAVSVPVFLSSLMQVPCVFAMTQRRVGILTASRPNLTPFILEHAGISAAIPLAIGGLQDVPAFRDPILSDGPTLDRAEIQASVVGIAQDLGREYPDIGVFVMECHNLAPYGSAVASATGKPVFDVVSFARWVYDSIVKREFPYPQAG